MNEIKIKVNFEKRFCTIDGENLKRGEIDATKLVFDFDDNSGTKAFYMKGPDGVTIIDKKIDNNEIRLFSIDKKTQQKKTIFDKAGDYEFEVVNIKRGKKLPSATGTLHVEESIIEIGNLDEFLDKSAIYKDGDLFVTTARDTLVCPVSMIYPVSQRGKFLLFNIILPKRLTNIFSFNLHEMKGYIDGVFYDFTKLGLIYIDKATDNTLKVEIYLRDSVNLQYVTSIAINSCIIEFSSKIASPGENPYCEVWFHNTSNVELEYTGMTLIPDSVSANGGLGLRIHKPQTTTLFFNAPGYKECAIEVTVTSDDIIDGIVKNFDIVMEPIEEEVTEEEELDPPEGEGEE